MNALEEKISIIREASQQLNALAKQSYALDDRYASEAEEYDTWLSDKANMLTDFADKAEELMKATRDMQEMANWFNPAYLELQEKMLQENKQFVMVSNIMKYKHDTAKTAINNIR